jgi:hypothetical protein
MKRHFQYGIIMMHVASGEFSAKKEKSKNIIYGIRQALMLVCLLIYCVFGLFVF